MPFSLNGREQNFQISTADQIEVMLINCKFRIWQEKIERNEDNFDMLVLQSTGTGYVIMVLGDAFGLLGGF